MTARTAVMAALEGDVDLDEGTGFAEYLTGGIFDAADLPDEGLTPGQPPDAWDDYGNVIPCAVVRFRGPQPYGPHYEEGSERAFVEIYVYQQTGVDTIEAALKRLKTLLNRAVLDDSGERIRVKWNGEQGELPADEVGGAMSMMARFELVKFR